MKQIHSPLILLVLLTFIITGCASITKGTSQTITVSSNVEGATIFLDDEMIGSTPFAGPVKKNKKFLKIEAEGYGTENVALSKSLEPIFWGNIIIGGTLGSITDFATGAAYQYAPASYQIDLKASGQTGAAFLREVGVRKFGMLYIDSISQDIADGGGQYIDALVALSLSSEGEGLNVSGIASALEVSRGNQVAFGNRLVDLL
ncbi:MAG: PEGA domain-containing protein [Rhodothermales bacterium]